MLPISIIVINITPALNVFANGVVKQKAVAMKKQVTKYNS